MVARPVVKAHTSIYIVVLQHLRFDGTRLHLYWRTVQVSARSAQRESTL